MMTQRHSFAVVISLYNEHYVQGLLENFKREMAMISPNANLAIHEVPGAFEIPLMVHEIAAGGDVEAIVALGLILRGQTAHADFIGNAVTQALMEVSLRFKIPVVHEVLLVDHELQAQERCLDPAANRGAEAARAALRMSQALAEFRARA